MANDRMSAFCGQNSKEKIRTDSVDVRNFK